MDIVTFTRKLTTALADELYDWRNRLYSEQIRAFNLGCYPWHGRLELSFLTANEYFGEAENAKWIVGDWRWYHFTSGWKSSWERGETLATWINTYYNDSEDKRKTTDELFHACAQAITSSQVIAELRKYNLTDDFEVSVFNSDEPFPQRNYCDRTITLP